MGIVKKVAALAGIAAVGALASKNATVKKAVKGILSSGKKEVKELAAKPEVKEAKAKVARIAKKVGVKKPRAARRKARHAAHAAT